jgi:hypothetical protein
MSTKTTFKRVALVAVAALGLGTLSVAPSSAASLAVTVVPSATTSAIKVGETATVSLTVTAITGADTDSLTVHGVRTKGTSGTIYFQATTDSTTTRVNLGSGAAAADKIIVDTATPSWDGSNSALRAVVKANFVAPAAAGTYEVTLYTSQAGTPGTTDVKPFVWTITVTADATAPDASSTALLQNGLWDGPLVADEVASGAKSATTPVGTIAVVQKNATSSASEAMQAYVTGPGFVKNVTADTASATSGSARVISVAAPAVGATTYFGVYADGTTGVATVTIVGAVSGVVLATKQVTFSDTKPSTIAVAVKKAYIAAGKTTTKVFAVTLKDAAGNAIENAAATVTGTRTDTTTAGKAIATADLSFSWDSTDKVYYASAAGASASYFGKAEYKITATGTDADETTVSTTASTTYSDIVATKVTITAPATAAVGDKVTYTLTATDKNGYPIADASYEGGSANGSVGGIFWNTTTVPDYTSTSAKPFNAGETITTVSGVATKDIYMPVAAGTVAATWTLAGKSTAPVGAIDKSIAGTTVTVSTVVTNAGVDAATDAANEATDAANAATDAALAAADAADAATAAAQDASDAVAALSATVAKLVASLKAQITSLTNLVIKIQKKVRA